MITVTLFAASIVAVSILTWIFRRRFAKHLPSKEAMSTFCLVAPVGLLLLLAILPNVILLFVTINLMPTSIKAIIGLVAAAAIIYSGCKKTETPKQPAIQWTAPDTGYHAETPPTIPKEGQ